ncbi:protein-glutamate O-methyltransferase CheR [Mucilaginibacter sp. BT774]|uniref:CheR family methyltransferase n=1 Tax=Mucilaginibacter sp. BT774 TaxID=3062276 RepID=UPI002675DF1B|nr:protein-glutamate O-methyltransferase CheR [Mucilaginibacter sp. BT774]MDO3626342.1 protein-glutamate O-methyltransferase CheR [Mucilaginibacter sp. BT774]
MTTLPGALTDSELHELIELVKEKHGFDFSNYSKASLRRRLSRITTLKRVGFTELKDSLANNADFFRWFLNEVTVNVTEMFRDPSFFRTLNTFVVPHLSQFKAVRVWSAGCSSGEEVYSLSILLNQSKLNSEPFIYGTDINTAMIEEAQRGVYSMRKIKSYAENYKLCELPGSLTDYFNVMNDVASIKKELKQNILFSSHNLVTNDVFNEFQIISCRNVFIYFDAALQEKILGLFYKSLCPNGFLCLGSKETIRFPEYKNKFKVVSQKENIYQKVGG